MDSSSLRQAGFRPYRKRGITYAHKVSQPFSVRLKTNDVIYGEPGDYLAVSPEDGSRWVVNAQVFESTYTRLDLSPPTDPNAIPYKLIKRGFQPYQKHSVTWAQPLKEARLIKTLEGPVQASAGDYLCVGINGEQWPQPRQRFESQYEAIEKV